MSRPQAIAYGVVPQGRLIPGFKFGRHIVTADSRKEAIGRVVMRAGAGVLDTNVIDNGDGTWTVRYAIR